MATIFILGDSTSMTVGVERKSYPYLLASCLSWPEDTRLLNISQPGITAADAAAFFFRFSREYHDLKAVIMYLGNCDANADELPKGRITPLRLMAQRVKETFGFYPPKAAFRNKLMRMEWNEFYNGSFEQVEAVEDFEYNLTSIVNTCRRRSIPIVLVRPRANHSFPAGVGKGNFIYYHYLALPLRLAPALSHPDPRFLKAFAAYERGCFTESRFLYKTILDDMDASGARAEYPLIVAHNYAAACAREGRNDEALALFDLLLKEPAIRKEIVLFNKAFVLGSKGDRAVSDRCLCEAYETDSSMYRIKTAYLNAIDRLAANNSGAVRLVDMSVFCDDDFVDHCHLLPMAQEKLADMIGQALSSAGVMNGVTGAHIEQRLFNPELSFGNTKSFFDYYRVYAPLTTEQIRRDIDMLRSDVGEGEAFSDRALGFVSDSVAKAAEYARKHPCFADTRDFLRLAPDNSLDVGRFPEYFLMRRLAPYLDAAISEAPAAEVLRGTPGLLRSGKELAMALPPLADNCKTEALLIEEGSDKEWVLRIIANVRTALVDHLKQGPRIYERLETTIFWYFRELLRWGSHSRVSMRYERMPLEFVAEALAVASWLDLKLCAGERNHEILDLAGALVRVVCIHEKYCLQFKLSRDNASLMTAYDRALNDELKNLQKEAIGVNTPTPIGKISGRRVFEKKTPRAFD